MRRNTIGIAAATLAAAGAIGVAGAAIASAADDSTVTASPSASSSTAPGGTGPGGVASQDTAVTGTEADKVIAAVKAKDSAVTITTVRKDPDGSYDAIGTKSGSPVFYDVSADLKTVTAGGGRGGHGGPGGGASQDTAVTGTEADKVIAAVKAKDSAVTITTVRKDPDGSYDAIGTKSGSPVFYDVSEDLKTITGAAGGHGGAPAGTGTLPGQSGATSNSSSHPTDANGATAI